MTHPPPPVERCPRCGGASALRPKVLLIGKESPRKKFHGEDRVGFRRGDQLAVDEVLPEALRAAPLAQFVDGWYCDACGAGFVPDALLSPERES